MVPVARPCLILTPDPKHFFLYPGLNIFFYVSERPTFFPVVPDFIRHDNTVFRSTNSVNKNGGARRAHCLLACKVKKCDHTKRKQSFISVATNDTASNVFHRCHHSADANFEKRYRFTAECSLGLNASGEQFHVG